MNPKQRDIFLVPIPFSDLRTKKRRPVVILSSDLYNDSSPDCLVMAMTSRVDPKNQYGITFSNQNLTEGLLPKESQIRVDKIYSVHQKILIRRFGKLNEQTYRAALNLLAQLIDPSNSTFP